MKPSDYLRNKVLSRNRESFFQELKRREYLLRNEAPVYSTEVAERLKAERLKNKGCMPCSPDLKPRRGTETVGNSKYASMGGRAAKDCRGNAVTTYNVVPTARRGGRVMKV